MLPQMLFTQMENSNGPFHYLFMCIIVNILFVLSIVCISWFSTRRKSMMCFGYGTVPTTEECSWGSWVARRCPRMHTALSTPSPCSSPQTSSPASRASLCSFLVSRWNDGMCVHVESEKRGFCGRGWSGHNPSNRHRWSVLGCRCREAPECFRKSQTLKCEVIG